MATRSLTAPSDASGLLGDARSAVIGAAESWTGFHFFYHSDRNQVLDALVRPLTAALLDRELIETFFFIRYGLGGPHIRLRLVAYPGRLDDVRRTVESFSAEFFRRRPSRSSIDADEIRRRNRGIVAADPLATEADDIAPADNSVSEHRVAFEIDRYGGPEFLPHSLDLFALSSIQAFHFAHARGDRPAGKQVADVLRIMARHAWGLARNAEEFVELTGFAVDFMGDQLVPCVEEGDRIFERQRTALRTVVRTTMDQLAGSGPATDPGSPFSVADFCRAFAAEIRGVEESQRWFVCASQMHMTANRLGLFNSEEVYTSRLLWRAAIDLAETEPRLWRRWWRAHESAAPTGGLLELLRGALDHLRRQGRGQPG